MNPNVAHIIKDLPFSPVKHVWFDLSDEESLKLKMDSWMQGRAIKDVLPNDIAKDIPLPFDNIALILPIGLRAFSGDIRPEKFVFTIERVDDSLKMAYWFKTYSKPIMETSFHGRLLDKPSSMEVNPLFAKNSKGVNSDPAEKIMLLTRFSIPVFGAICYSEPNKVFATECYKCTPNPANANRIRRGKRPLFEWETVLIKPTVKEVSASHGGTHASPKPHDRRGHQRRYKNGKVVYIKPCTINKHKIKEEGFIHHDYKVVN